MQLAIKKKAATFSLRAIKSNLRVVADRNVVSVDSISSGAGKRCRLTNLVMIFFVDLGFDRFGGLKWGEDCVHEN